MIWITGFPCSGKTSLANELKNKINANGIKAIVLDGDDFRKVLNISYDDPVNFSLEKRKKLSEIYTKTAKLIEDQGILTIISTVSMNHSIREFNRKIHTNYLEVYIQESYELLKLRDNKGIYFDLSPDEIDLKWKDYERPLSPDILLPMSNNLTLEESVDIILNKLDLK